MSRSRRICSAVFSPMISGDLISPRATSSGNKIPIRPKRNRPKMRRAAAPSRSPIGGGGAGVPLGGGLGGGGGAGRGPGGRVSGGGAGEGGCGGIPGGGLVPGGGCSIGGRGDGRGNAPVTKSNSKISGLRRIASIPVRGAPSGKLAIAIRFAARCLSASLTCLSAALIRDLPTVKPVSA